MTQVIDTSTDLDFKLELHADGDLMVTAPRPGYFVITAEQMKNFACTHQKHAAKAAAKSKRANTGKPTPATAPIKPKARQRAAK